MQEWFDQEIAKLIHACEKSFLKLKNQSFTLMKKITKKYQVQNFIIKKKREFYETNLKQR